MPEKRHDVARVIDAVSSKLRAKAELIEHADDHFTVEIYKKGQGYDVKLKTTL